MTRDHEYRPIACTRPLRIVLAPVGTRGDVQPILVLAAELARRGHSITVCAPANFAEDVREQGFRFERGAPDYSRFTDEIRAEPFLTVLSRQVPEQFSQLAEVARGADAVVGSMLQLAGPSVCERFGIPYFYMVPAPVFARSGDHPPVTVRRQTMPRWLNELAWARRGWNWNRQLRPALDAARRDLGLAPLTDAQDNVLHSGHVLLAYEPALAPTPRLRCHRFTVTGAWFDDQGTLDPAIESFCAAGPPPVFVGFGSMTHASPQHVAAMISEAIRRVRRRVIVGVGWSGMEIDGMASDVLVIRSAPFQRLLPKVAAAVHHGGAGTTASVARAGIPQAIIPHFADQYYWGMRIARAGLGPPPVPIEDLTVERLAAIIDDLVSTPLYVDRARQVASQIDPARGVTAAADIIEAEA